MRFCMLSLLPGAAAANFHDNAVQNRELAQQATTASPPAPRLYGLSNTTIYSILLIVVTILSPILVTSLAHFLPRTFSTIKGYLLTPLFSRQLTPSLHKLLHQSGSPPTTGVFLYILLIFSLTLLFTFINHQYKPPHFYTPSLTEHPYITYLFQRTGVLAFAFLPVIILFSSRSNVFSLLVNLLPTRLGVSTFSHATFVVLHRWIGRLCALLVIAHSILALPLYLSNLESHTRQAYWIWGAIATLSLTSLVIFGAVVFRRRWHEAFLIGHILLSVLVLVGCWYHVAEWMDFKSGKGEYEAWVLGAAAVWGFDRLFRFARVVKNGLHRAKVTELGTGEYARVDIPGAKAPSRPGMHVYAQFPGLRLGRAWENHPFSVVPTALLGTGRNPDDKEVSESSGESGRSSPAPSSCKDGNMGPTKTSASELDVEKGLQGTEHRVKTLGPERKTTNAGITLLIKRLKGLTKDLKALDRLLTLLDGPYPNNSNTSVLQCERLLLIGGGIGITCVLPWISYHSNVKLAWSLKENGKCLLDELAQALDKISEKEISIGRRLGIGQLLNEERDLGWSRVGVVASGPVSLCDDVRTAVAMAGRKRNTTFELEVDAYSW